MDKRTEIRGQISEYDNRRTESAEPNGDFEVSLWKHTPPLEGRGRAVRRKVNGRVTGWNPPPSARERGQGVRQAKNSKNVRGSVEVHITFFRIA